MIQLKDIDHSNWIRCIELEITEEQKQFVNPNIFSLAEAYVHSGEKKDAEEFYRCMPFAIYSDEGMVGFTMITYEKETDYDDKAGYEIYRIMIDRKHQGKGYGKEALKLILEYIKTFPCGKAESVYAEWHPNNIASNRLFEEYDFIVVGTDEDGAVVARMNISN